MVHAYKKLWYYCKLINPKYTNYSINLKNDFFTYYNGWRVYQFALYKGSNNIPLKKEGQIIGLYNNTPNLGIIIWNVTNIIEKKDRYSWHLFIL